MKLLAIESSTDLLSVALAADGDVTEMSGERGRSHSDLILVWVRELLAGKGLEIPELDAIAFGAGPGGFTGLRLGCAVAQGLAFEADVPLIGVGSLEVMAAGAGGRRVLVCVDARMEEVYCAAYDLTGGSPAAVIAPVVSSPALAPLPPGGGWLACGSGFRAYGPQLRERFGACVGEVRGDAPARASVLARLAAERLACGHPHPGSLALPLYVRDRVALTIAERRARGGRA